MNTPTNDKEAQLGSDKRSGRSVAIATVLGTAAGIGIALGIAYATGSTPLAVGMAGGLGVLFTNILRKSIK